MRVLIGACFLIFIFTAIAHAAPVIEVKSYVKVEADQKLRLGQLLTFQDIEQDLQRKISAIILGNPPALGEQRVYTDAALSEILRRQIGSMSEKIRLVIPSRVRVENRGFELKPSSIEAYLKNQWSKNCDDCRIKIKALSLPLLPRGQGELPMRIELKNEIPRGTFSVPLKAEAATGRSSTYWISGQVEIHRKVPVLQRAVQMGERIQPQDIVEDYRDVTFANDGILTVKQLIGRKARRMLRAQDIVWAQTVEREKAVRRGEVVRAIIGEEQWSMTVMAQAEQDGYIGDVINLKNPASQKQISGEVTADGEVKIR